MASGKSFEKQKPRFIILYHNDGQPVRRAHPKEHMSKKERLRRHREEKELTAVLNKQMYGNTAQGGNANHGRGN
jgi:hypothetical protein